MKKAASRTSVGATETNAGTIITPTGTPRTRGGATEQNTGTTPTVAPRNGKTKREYCTLTNEDKKMPHTHMLAIIAGFGFSTNCRKKTALEAVQACAEKGNVRAIQCLEQLSEEGADKINRGTAPKD